METETRNPFMDPWRERKPGELPAASTQPTPEQQARWEAYKRQQAQQLVCTRCGTDNHRRECPDWCLAIESGCDCGSALCGVCQRRLGTSTASMGHPYR